MNDAPGSWIGATVSPLKSTLLPSVSTSRIRISVSTKIFDKSIMLVNGLILNKYGVELKKILEKLRSYFIGFKVL